MLVHGWGLGARVFDSFAGRLAHVRTVLQPDLPGCGASRTKNDPIGPGGDLGDMAAAVLATVDRPAHWVGWSLGGLVALEAARRAPDRVTRLTLIAATPRMVAAPDWPGIDPAELVAFQQALEADVRVTHRRFLALQAHGCPDGRAVLRALHAAAAADGLPERPALDAGLAVLRHADLRDALPALSCRVDLILGGRDALVPCAAAGAMRALGIPVRVVPEAGHVPFVSHPGPCVEALLE